MRCASELCRGDAIHSRCCAHKALPLHCAAPLRTAMPPLGRPCHAYPSQALAMLGVHCHGTPPPCNANHFDAMPLLRWALLCPRKAFEGLRCHATAEPSSALLHFRRAVHRIALADTCLDGPCHCLAAYAMPSLRLSGLCRSPALLCQAVAMRTWLCRSQASLGHATASLHCVMPSQAVADHLM